MNCRSTRHKVLVDLRESLVDLREAAVHLLMERDMVLPECADGTGVWARSSGRSSATS